MIRFALKEYCEGNNITPYSVAKKANIREATIYGYVNEDRRSVDLDNLYKIMKALEIDDINKLLVFDEDDDNDKNEGDK